MSAGTSTSSSSWGYIQGANFLGEDLLALCPVHINENIQYTSVPPKNGLTFPRRKLIICWELTLHVGKIAIVLQVV